MPILNVLDEEWAIFEKFFKDNPNAIKFKKPDPSIHSAIKTANGEIYALPRKNSKNNYPKDHPQYNESNVALLGEGTYGSVRVVEKRNGQNIADKVQTNRPEAFHEYEILNRIGVAHGQVVYKEKMHIFQNLEEGINLAKYIDIIGLTDREKHLIALYTSLDLYYKFHSRSLVHGDLKPQNIVVSINDNQIKLAIVDVGNTKILNEGKTYVIDKNHSYGTATYLAPEVGIVNIELQKDVDGDNFFAENPLFYDANGHGADLGPNPLITVGVSGWTEGKFSYASDVWSLGEIFSHQNDLDLPEALWKGMLEKDVAKRDTLFTVIGKLIHALENNASFKLEDEDEKLIAEARKLIMPEKLEELVHLDEEKMDATAPTVVIPIPPVEVSVPIAMEVEPVMVVTEVEPVMVVTEVEPVMVVTEVEPVMVVTEVEPVMVVTEVEPVMVVTEVKPVPAPTLEDKMGEKFTELTLKISENQHLKLNYIVSQVYNSLQEEAQKELIYRCRDPNRGIFKMFMGRNSDEVLTNYLIAMSVRQLNLPLKPK